MKKLTAIILTLTFLLTFSGCTKPSQGEVSVYSFSGENNYFEISNGVIVLGDNEEVLYGGDLKEKDDFFSNITSYSVSFYVLSEGEQKIIMSNDALDEMGNTIRVSGSLGKIAGDTVITAQTKDIENLENHLFFEINVVTVDGIENKYQIQLTVEKIT